MLRSRNTWTRHCNMGHRIVKHVIILARRMQSWRNVVSARSHDTAVMPIVYKHGTKVGFATRSCVHICSAGARSSRAKKLLLSYAMHSAMTFSNVSLLPSRNDAFNAIMRRQRNCRMKSATTILSILMILMMIVIVVLRRR